MYTTILKKTIAFAICIVAGFSTFAQDTWSLQQCVDYAIKNNIQIKQTLLNTELSKTNLTQSEASVLPNLNANASNYYNYGKTIDQFTNSFATEKVRSDRYSLQANVTLFNGLQAYNTIKQNQLNLSASKYDVEKMVSDISLYVASAYLRILFDMELLDIANQQVLLTKAQVERTKKLVDAGSVAKGNLLNIEAQAANEELQVVNAQNNLDIDYLSLTQLLELTDAKNFKISRPAVPELLNAEIKEEVGAIYQNALANRPEIKSAEIKVRSAQKGISIAKGAYSPQLTMGGSYGSGYSGLSKRLVGEPTYGIAPTGYFTSSNEPVLGPVLLNSFEKTPYSKQINDNINKSFGFNLSIPIFNGFQVKSAVSRAKINTANAQLNLESAQKQLYKSIQQSYADAQAALKKYAATQIAVSSLRESFQYSEQRFTLGMLNPLEYNDAKNKLTKAESDLVQAKYDFVFKQNILNFYQGKPISF
ncbi:MAG: TolC family protein [Bacteroidetes bacterium]|nr:TolC family protein [Bacteroidota bacterium]